jgi:hypothetical protein
MNAISIARENSKEIICRNKYFRTVLFLLSLVVGEATAWDGQRQGFLLGIGFGAGFDSFSGVQYDELGTDKMDNSSIAFAASPRIGYAINNRMAFYYSRHPLVYGVENEFGKDVSIVTCIEALQFQYYLNETGPSFYFGVGGGIGYLFDDEISNYSSKSLKGIGFIGAAGYEFLKHYSTEFSIHYKSPQNESSNLGVSLLVTILGY